MEEVIDLDLNHLDNDDTKTPSVDFGGGIELLMNDKKKSSSKGNDISLDKELEELNDIEDIGKNTSKMDTQPPMIFKKISEINIEKEVQEVEHKTKEDILKEKFNYLRKLEQLESKGVTLSKRYSMESSLDEMKGE